MKQSSFKCSCVICKKVYSSLGIDTHYLRAHGNREDKMAWDNSIKVKHDLKRYNIDCYDNDPVICKQCTAPVPYENRSNTFCNSSCSATYNNVKRGPRSDQTKERMRISQSKRDRPLFWGEYCKVLFRSCKFCREPMKYNINNKSIVCANCQHLKYSNNRDQWTFKFNVYDYPDRFDLARLTKIGWCSFGGKRGGPKNLNGLSRDHRVSIDEAKRNNYDAYYISHVCNCALITMTENNKKKISSSMSYSQLIQEVDSYDIKNR